MLSFVQRGGVARLLLCLFLTLAISHGFAHDLRAQTATEYTPDQVLDQIRASRRRISNATFECLWKTFIEPSKRPNGITFGGPPHWEKQTFYWDDLGRRRNILERGPLSQDGKMLEADDPCLEDTVYNGEVVANIRFHPKQTRIGGKPKSSKEATGYNPVIIGDSAAPLRSGLESERNPLEYISNIGAHEIEAAIKRHSIVVKPAKDGKLVLEIKHSDPKSPYSTSLITVVPKHNWAIESIESYRSDGGLAREIVFDYKEQADGIWVPVRGRHIHWGDRNRKATPYFDWRFETTKVVYNDPSFDQHVFDIRLKPDAAVSDTRYKVTYRIGDEGAVAADLARYAADARKAAEKKSPEQYGELSYAEVNHPRKVALTVTIILLIACISIFVMRQIRRRANYRS